MLNTLEIIFIVCAYLIGSIASAVITCRLMGLPDPRSQGSGNPGATNVLRHGGKKAAIFTLLGDLLKGYIPVAIAGLLNLSPPAIALVAIAAFFGHLFPVFFGFKGGKGVATAFGVSLALMPLIAGLMLATWIIMAIVFRYSSLAALTAAAMAPVYTILFSDIAIYVPAMTLISLVLIARHRSNISNLMSGQESRIGQKKSVEEQSPSGDSNDEMQS